MTCMKEIIDPLLTVKITFCLSNFIVMMREEEMKAAVLRAEGESEAARLVSDAITKNGPGLIAMRKIETA